MRCWAALPSKPEKQVAAMSAASISVVVGDGANMKLWMDNWTSVGALCHYAPQLFAAMSRTGLRLTVKPVGTPQH
jgi:hypothetical protein